jgi:hypothetical protein
MHSLELDMEKRETSLKRHRTTNVDGPVFWDVLGASYGAILWHLQRHMLTCQFACLDILGTSFDQGYVQVTVQSHQYSLISQLTIADVHSQPWHTLRDHD